jgi:hypothetical protein
MVHYTVPILQAVQTEVLAVKARAIQEGRSMSVLYWWAEPFYQHFTHSTPSAYPHPSTRPVTPSCFWFDFSNPADINWFHQALEDAADAVTQVSITEGQTNANDVLYSNYALSGTPPEKVFGASLPLLKTLKARVDPKDIMSLTGGFKVVA